MLIHDSETVLVVAAHPDDEVLGCGGAMARHVRAGCELHVVILSDGVAGRLDRTNSMEVELCARHRREQAQAAAAALGVTSVSFEDLPDNGFDSVELLTIVKLVEKHVARLSPGLVYTHHYGDLNIDHRLTHQAVLTACRPIAAPSVRGIVCFEVLSSTEWQSPQVATAFMPNFFVDISKAMDAKLLAAEKYDSELREFPHPRSCEGIRTLARQRGMTIGAEAAEAFWIARIIEYES